MLINLIRWLRDAGVDAVVLRAPRHIGTSGVDALVTVGNVTFAVQRSGRAPYPNEIPRLDERRNRLQVDGVPLLLAPFVSEPLGAVLVSAGWSWADEHGNFDIRAPGLLLRQRRTASVPRTGATTMPRGSGSSAIVRALVRFGEGEEEDGNASALAAQTGISQPRVSQVLARLSALGLVTKTGRGRWRPDREALLDRFLDEYRGPGGTTDYFYSLDPLSDVAVTMAKGAREGDVVVSADVGPDLVVPWRRPSLMVVYARGEFDPAIADLVSAQGRDDANVFVRYPTDTSVFPTHALVADVKGVEIQLADPSQMIWDLTDLGGADRLEAAGVMREWLLRAP